MTTEDREPYGIALTPEQLAEALARAYLWSPAGRAEWDRRFREIYLKPAPSAWQPRPGESRW